MQPQGCTSFSSSKSYEETVKHFLIFSASKIIRTWLGFESKISQHLRIPKISDKELLDPQTFILSLYIVVFSSVLCGGAGGQGRGLPY